VGSLKEGQPLSGGDATSEWWEKFKKLAALEKVGEERTIYLLGGAFSEIALCIGR
jgi:hypothetical protein